MEHPDTKLPDTRAWGHISPPISPIELIQKLKFETERALREYRALPEGPESCTDKPGYSRVSVSVPIDGTLFDQLMNGCTGYRAHYSVGIASGEEFNRRLVDEVALVIVKAESLYRDRFDQSLCQRSLLGSFSKFWFPKELTDPCAQNRLEEFSEELRVPRWIAYRQNRPKPRKGLLAPVPESNAILLNGTFVSGAGEEYEQRPRRSKEIFESGWT